MVLLYINCFFMHRHNIIVITQYTRGLYRHKVRLLRVVLGVCYKHIILYIHRISAGMRTLARASGFWV